VTAEETITDDQTGQPAAQPLPVTTGIIKVKHMCHGAKFTTILDAKSFFASGWFTGYIGAAWRSSRTAGKKSSTSLSRDI
jgi:hypothetical protein